MLEPTENNGRSSNVRNADKSDDENHHDAVINDVDDQKVHNINTVVSGTKDAHDHCDSVDGLAADVEDSGDHDNQNDYLGLNAVTGPYNFDDDEVARSLRSWSLELIDRLLNLLDQK